MERKVKLERTVKPFLRQILSSTHARALQAIIMHRDTRLVYKVSSSLDPFKRDKD